MSITYSAFKAGKTKIQFSNKTVLGFLTVSEGFETRYAVYESGAVLKSCPVECHTPAANSFASRSWSQVNSVPDDAEFIGNYPMPI